MRIVVCAKQVYDPKTVKISRSREEADLREAAKILNPLDKYALEAALRLRAAAGGEVIALTVSSAGAEDAAREAIAIGADRGTLVVAGADLAANAVTRLLAAAVERLGGVDLVLTGALAATDGTGSLAPRLAAALGWPVVLDVVTLAWEASALQAIVAGPAGGCLVPVALPAALAVTAGAERPRYPHPARIANAWDDGLLERLSPADLGVGADALAPDTQPGNLILGPERVRGQIVGGGLAEAAASVAGLLRAKRVVA
jgi:electron transfer flavoprotein beta subunit